MKRFFPLLSFAGLAVLLFFGLGNADRKQIVPSPLIDRQAPAFQLPVLDQPERLISRDELLGQAYLLNVWASWCPPCRLEHNIVTQLAIDGPLPVYGLNYKDEPDDAQRWLQTLGNPYALILADRTGRTSIDFGVYGAPETFLIDAAGHIRYKFVGPLTAETVEHELLPAIAALDTGQRGSP